MHSCVGRIRYLGVMLYDADRIEKVASSDDKDLLHNQLDIYLDPNDPVVIAEARKNGVHDSTIKAAQNSPVYKFVKEWGIALPLHPEFRTLPNLFYVPPMMPAMGQVDEKGLYQTSSEEFFPGIDQNRMPMKYLASLFSNGDTKVLTEIYERLLTVKMHRRQATVKDLSEAALKLIAKSKIGPDTADAIFRLTSLATFEERFVIPPAHREEAIEMIQNTADAKGETGFGIKLTPKRGL
jgi:nitrate reductase beta subunit